MKIENYRVGKKENGKLLGIFLSERLRCSKRRAKALLDRRSVYVNRRRIWMAKHRLTAGDDVEVQVDHQNRNEDGIKVLWRDDDLLVVNKPAGLLTQGTHGVESRLRAQLDAPSLMAVHRLDRNSSGCLLFAMTPKTRDGLVELFRQRVVRKEYLAIVCGHCVRRKREIRKSVDGKSAVTRVQVLDSQKEASLLSCWIETGRTHQIRRHLASAGNPVAGDKKYGKKLVEESAFRNIPRQMLHAWKLEFRHPSTGKLVNCTAPPPSDFTETMRKFSLVLRRSD
jgi:RluA family pseudouridine synthase